MYNLTIRQKEELVLWLINSRQMTPDQALDEVENFPNRCYFEFLKVGLKTNSKSG